MIKVFLKNNQTIKFELGDEKKEIELVFRFHSGLDGNAVLKLKKSHYLEEYTRVRVSDIQNMQYSKDELDKTTTTGINNPFYSEQNSKFKTREEYEKWKEQKIRENKRNSSQKRGQQVTVSDKKTGQSHRC
jgi:hypothetical protein